MKPLCFFSESAEGPPHDGALRGRHAANHVNSTKNAPQANEGLVPNGPRPLYLYKNKIHWTHSPLGPGPVWAEGLFGPKAHWAQGPFGPIGPRGRLGPGPIGPVWAQGPLGPGSIGPGAPLGPCPFGARPIFRGPFFDKGFPERPFLEPRRSFFPGPVSP